MFILIHPVNFLYKAGNRGVRRKPATFGRAFTDSFTRVRNKRIKPMIYSEVKGACLTTASIQGGCHPPSPPTLNVFLYTGIEICPKLLCNA